MGIEAEPSSKVRANRAPKEAKEKSDAKPKETAKEKPIDLEKAKPDKSVPTKAPPMKKAAEKASGKDKDKEKAAEKSTAGAAATDKDTDKEKAAEKAKRPPTQELPDDLLNFVAATKWETGEEKLKEIMKAAVGLVRDLHKLSAAERAKKVSEVQKALVKFEFQNVRAWDLQVKQRQMEVETLEAQAKGHRSGAEAESQHITELRHRLQLEQAQHNRYLTYEERAAEVNQKRSRDEYQKAIADTTETIERLRKRRRDCEALAEQELKEMNDFAERVRKLREARQEKQKLLGKELEGIRPREPTPSPGRDSRDASDSEPMAPMIS